MSAAHSEGERGNCQICLDAANVIRRGVIFIFRTTKHFETTQRNRCSNSVNFLLIYVLTEGPEGQL
jgi:hypothetical protein